MFFWVGHGQAARSKAKEGPAAEKLLQMLKVVMMMKEPDCQKLKLGDTSPVGFPLMLREEDAKLVKGVA